MSRPCRPQRMGGSDFQAIDLSYEGGELAMVVLLREGGFQAVEESLTEERLDAITAALRPTGGHLRAKFRYEAAGISLKEALRSLGVQ